MRACGRCADEGTRKPSSRVKERRSQVSMIIRDRYDSLACRSWQSKLSTDTRAALGSLYTALLTPDAERGPPVRRALRQEPDGERSKPGRLGTGEDVFFTQTSGTSAP
nr:hypothetical protein Iba_chr10cCG10970 [Ipomoea batatas]